MRNLVGSSPSLKFRQQHKGWFGQQAKNPARTCPRKRQSVGEQNGDQPEATQEDDCLCDSRFQDEAGGYKQRNNRRPVGCICGPLLWSAPRPEHPRNAAQRRIGNEQSGYCLQYDHLFSCFQLLHFGTSFLLAGNSPRAFDSQATDTLNGGYLSTNVCCHSR